VNPRHLRDYAARAWDRVAAHKRAYWTRAVREGNDLATFDASQALWVHMRQLRPEWPTAAERHQDLARHVALKRALDRAARGAIRATDR
jgi:hypothetical protein